MTTKFQVTIDCAAPALLARFWATALGYEIERPPPGFDGWNAYWRSIGVPEEELADSDDAGDSLIDPSGRGPRIWFQRVPEAKSVKNRLHLDLDASVGRTVAIALRRQRVDAEAERLAAAGASRLYVLQQEGLDHYSITMQDPEGNEFCIH